MLRMPEERENELVQMAQKGSTKAFTELEKQYHWLVFKVIAGILREAAGKAGRVETEDVLQDVFEYAFVHIKDFRKGSRFYCWLWGLAKVGAMRRRSKLWDERGRFTEYDDDIESEDFGAPDSWTAAVTDLEQYIKSGGDGEGEDPRLVLLRVQIRNLPKQQRADILAYADGEKPSQIAGRTGRDVRAIYTSLNDAKYTLKNYKF